VVQESILELNREGFNFEVIRVEDFPSLNKTPQRACLEGVIESDIYLGIYGERYGWKDSPVGISPTHEEYLKAKKEKKKILVFIEEGKKESEQIAFLREVEDYIKGRHRVKFKNLEGLKWEISRALRYLITATFEYYLPEFLSSVVNEFEKLDLPFWAKKVEHVNINEIIPLSVEAKESSNIKAKESLSQKKESVKKIKFSNAVKSNDKLTIIGEPGSGKTTCLRWLTYRYAKAKLKFVKEKSPHIINSEENFSIPVYLELKDYKDDIFKLINGFFARHHINCDKEVIKRWFRRQKFIFLLDGFNEVSKKSDCIKDIKEVIDLSTENKFVVTSRKIDLAEKLGFQEIKISELTDDEIKILFKKNMGDKKGETLFDELKTNNLLDEFRTPMMALFATLIFEQKQEEEFIVTKGQLFKKVIEDYFLKKWDKKIIHQIDDIERYYDLKIECLSKLAFEMISKEWAIIKEKKVHEIFDKSLQEGRANYKELRDELLKQIYAHQLLIKTETGLRFWHMSFRDYFGSVWLRENFDSKRIFKLIKEENREEAIIFLCGILDKSRNFNLLRKLVKSVRLSIWLSSRGFPTGCRRIVFVARCLRHSNPNNWQIKDKFINQLPSTLYFDTSLIEDLYTTIAEFKTEVSAKYLANNLKGPRGQVIARALRRTRSDVVIHPLIEALENDPDPIVKEYSAISLVTLSLRGSKKAVNSICRILHSGGEEARREILLTLKGVFHEDTLGKNYNEEITKQLAKTAIYDGNSDIRGYATEAIYNSVKSELKSGEDLLIQAALTHKDPAIRNRVINNFLHSFSDKSLKAVIKALDNDSREVGITAAWVLSWRSNRKFNQLIVSFIEKEYRGNNTILMIIQSLKKIIKKQYINIEDEIINKLAILIFALLCDPNTNIRFLAARALISFRLEVVKNSLVKALEDEKEIVRKESIRALSLSFGKEAEEYFVTALKDRNIEVRKQAMYALKSIKSKKIVLSLNDEDEEFRKVAIWLIVTTLQKDAGEYLLKSLNDKSPKVRAEAANYLINIEPTEKAISSLKKLLKDEDSYVRYKAECTLLMYSKKFNV